MKQNDYNKLIEATAKCILCPETKCAIISPNKDKSKEVYDKLILLERADVNMIKDNENLKITFKNGSIIECLQPIKEEGTIRGKRASIKNWLYDYEFIDKDILDKVLTPYINKEN